MKNLILTTIVTLIIGAAVSYKVRTLQSAPPQNPRETVHADGDFRIEGTVINVSGDSVAGATVFAELEGAKAKTIPTAVSDNNGNFSLTIRELGQYTIYGSKEVDGYPLTVSGFHQPVSLDQIPKLNVTERKTVSNVILQLGDKAPTLEGVVKDDFNSEPVAASIVLRRADNPALVYRGSTHAMRPGKFNIPVSIWPFDVEVESPGYETWMSRHTQKESIKLTRGESRSLIINLRKKAQ